MKKKNLKTSKCRIFKQLLKKYKILKIKKHSNKEMHVQWKKKQLDKDEKWRRKRKTIDLNHYKKSFDFYVKKINK